MAASTGVNPIRTTEKKINIKGGRYCARPYRDVKNTKENILLIADKYIKKYPAAAQLLVTKGSAILPPIMLGFGFLALLSGCSPPPSAPNEIDNAIKYFNENRHLLNQPADEGVLSRFFDVLNIFYTSHIKDKSVELAKILLEHISKFPASQSHNASAPRIYSLAVKSIVEFGSPKEALDIMEKFLNTPQADKYDISEIVFNIAYVKAIGLNNVEEAEQSLDKLAKEFPDSLFLKDAILLYSEIAFMKNDKREGRDLLLQALDDQYNLYYGFKSRNYPHIKSFVSSIFQSVNINVDGARLKENQAITSGYIFMLYLLKIPSDFYKDLKEINLNSSIKRSSYGPSKIELEKERESAVIHEVGHHWYSKLASNDLMDIYNKVSWDTFSKEKLGQINSELNWRNQPIIIDPSMDMESLAASYGAVNPEEDFAVFFERYVADGPALRREIKKQLSDGKFKLAAKYLFLKYLSPYKRKEYKTNEEEGIFVSSVLKNIEDYKKRTSLDVPAAVSNIINKIIKH